MVLIKEVVFLSGILFSLSQDDYNVNEGDGGVEVCIDLVAGVPLTNIPIEISTQPGSAGRKFIKPITITITITAHTAVDDYATTNQSAFFATGSDVGTRLCINISIVDDILVEVIERFIINADSSDQNVEFEVGGDQANVTITDNDSKLEPRIYCLMQTNAYTAWFPTHLHSCSVPVHPTNLHCG